VKQITQMAALTIALAGLLAPALSNAEPLPLWEVGAGIGALSVPDYRGSEARSTYVLPAPYFVYRGGVS
jgi:outer membrane protein